MQVVRYAALAVIGGALLLSGCAPDKVAEKQRPVKLEETGQQGILRVILEPRAAERIGIETAPVREERVLLAGGAAARSIIPYGALMYDTKGEAWTYTSPQPLVFVRQRVVVEDIQGDRVILAQGPPPGTLVVTVGAAELMGAEHRLGD